MGIPCDFVADADNIAVAAGRLPVQPALVAELTLVNSPWHRRIDARHQGFKPAAGQLTLNAPPQKRRCLDVQTARRRRAIAPTPTKPASISA
jgi:hypothetical protein